MRRDAIDQKVGPTEHWGSRKKKIVNEKYYVWSSRFDDEPQTLKKWRLKNHGSVSKCNLLWEV